MLCPAGNNCSRWQYASFIQMLNNDFVTQFSNLNYDIFSPMLYGADPATPETGWSKFCGDFSYKNTSTKITLLTILTKDNLDVCTVDHKACNDNVFKDDYAPYNSPNKEERWGYSSKNGYIRWSDKPLLNDYENNGSVILSK